MMAKANKMQVWNKRSVGLPDDRSKKTQRCVKQQIRSLLCNTPSEDNQVNILIRTEGGR
jgi:hypothetical protein